MPDFKIVERSERYKEKYQDWLERADVLHHNFARLENRDIAWQPLKKDLSDSRVALVTTAGVHLKSDTRFEDLALDGDPTYRTIPSDASSRDLMITHNHYDHSDGDEDVNCVFPIDRVRDLVSQGVLGGTAPDHFGFMGFNPDPARIVEKGREVTQRLVDAKVDVALMTPG